MRYIGKSKISKIRPKPNASYPLLCLPQAFNNFVGKPTNSYETEHDDQQAFLVVLDKSENDVEQASSQVIQPVMQPYPEVTQQHSENNIEIAYQSLKSKLVRQKVYFKKCRY
ncbi:MAG TPA: hypothetical protein VEG44_04305 [Candidatus Acidoferrales bacterium]|nr:hypothetical protein [Candidatus Acidoferrales bacterium]